MDRLRRTIKRGRYRKFKLFGIYVTLSCLRSFRITDTILDLDLNSVSAVLVWMIQIFRIFLKFPRHYLMTLTQINGIGVLTDMGFPFTQWMKYNTMVWWWTTSGCMDLIQHESKQRINDISHTRHFGWEVHMSSRLFARFAKDYYIQNFAKRRVSIFGVSILGGIFLGGPAVDCVQFFGWNTCDIFAHVWGQLLMSGRAIIPTISSITY